VPIWQSLLYNHILPSTFDAAASLLLVLAIFKIFRIKDPATRFLFLFLPLLKPFIVLIDNASSMPQRESASAYHIGIRMPDPLGLIAAPFKEFGELVYDQSAVVMAILIAIIVISFLLVARWAQLFLFLNAFKKEETLSRIAYPHVYEILDGLVTKFDVKYPRLVITNKSQYVPFSIGYKMPIIVLSKDLIETFSKEQLEIMLAHELAHIGRRDTFTGWLSLILRDIMFFNPLIRPIYRMLEEEKEKACDRIALEKTGVSPKEIANTLIDVALFHKTTQPYQKPLYPALTKGLLFNKSTIERRVKSITGTVKKKKSSRVRTSLKIFLFVFLLYIQPGLMININGQILFLR